MGGGLGGEGVCLPRTPFGLQTAFMALYLLSPAVLSRPIIPALQRLFDLRKSRPKARKTLDKVPVRRSSKALQNYFNSMSGRPCRLRITKYFFADNLSLRTTNKDSLQYYRFVVNFAYFPLDFVSIGSIFY